MATLIAAAAYLHAVYDGSWILSSSIDNISTEVICLVFFPVKKTQKLFLLSIYVSIEGLYAPK